MINETLVLAGSVLYLASSIGVLAVVGLYILPGLYAGWKETKHDIDVECATYVSVVEALEKAEGRPVRIIIAEDES